MSTESLITAAANKYREKGWTVIAPSSGPNDLIASKDKKRFHFVRIPPVRATETPDEFNLFIQNALSNGATPVVAKIATSKTRSTGETAHKVTLTDANSRSRIIVS